ncbi:MAG: hypothetical protein QOD93_5791, partial [Acetobacteraceae bacterium]|nr:hypothetical protein [Acetobacteraceae bacterium]
APVHRRTHIPRTKLGRPGWLARTLTEPKNVLRRIHPDSANLFHGRSPLSEINNDLILAQSMPSGAVHTNSIGYSVTAGSRMRWCLPRLWSPRTRARVGAPAPVVATGGAAPDGRWGVPVPERGEGAGRTNDGRTRLGDDCWPCTRPNERGWCGAVDCRTARAIDRGASRPILVRVLSRKNPTG